MGQNQGTLIKKQYDNNRRNANIKLINVNNEDYYQDLQSDQLYSNKKEGSYSLINETTFLKANIQRTKERLKYLYIFNI